MRKLLFSVLLLSPYSWAQQVLNKEVVCDKPEVIMSTLVKDYEEKPFWMGKDGQATSGYVLLSNNKTKSWTLVQFNEQVACVLGAGDNHTPLQTTSKGVANVQFK